MDIALLIVLVALLGLMVVVTAYIPPLPSKSRFELLRLAEQGDERAKSRRRRLRHWKDLFALQRLIYSLLLIAVLAVAVSLLGWAGGIGVSIVIILVSGLAARIPFVFRHVQRLYRRSEPKLLHWLQRYHKVMWWLRLPAPDLFAPTLSSKAELEHVIESAHDAFSAEEKTFLLHSIRFTDQSAKDVMTPRGQIKSIKKSEMLGPLVLDDLHKTGHNCYPVTYGDIDHIVGILYLTDVLTVDTHRKHTAMVETAMDKRVLYIHEDRSLAEALSILIEAHRHVLVVVDDEGKTRGILTMGDIMQALFGYRLTHDEYEYSDPDAAASQR